MVKVLLLKLKNRSTSEPKTLKTTKRSIHLNTIPLNVRTSVVELECPTTTASMFVLGLEMVKHLESVTHDIKLVIMLSNTKMYLEVTSSETKAYFPLLLFSFMSPVVHLCFYMITVTLQPTDLLSPSTTSPSLTLPLHMSMRRSRHQECKPI